MKHLKSVESKFLELFGELIDAWDGNTDLFENFGDEIEEIFQMTPEKDMESTFW